MGLLNRETLNKAGCHLYSNFSETIQLYFEKPSDYKQRNNFVLRTTVSKCDAPILKCLVFDKNQAHYFKQTLLFPLLLQLKLLN